nr:S24 family peptidase [uncultured Porphyromonas sp.]
MDFILTVKERILQFLDEKEISKTLFFNKVGISPSNFKGAGKKSSIGSDLVVKILTEYPELSPEWLMLGEGEMLRAPSKQAANDPKKEIIPSHTPQEGIPLIPIEAWAGALSGEDYSIMESECERYIVPSFKDADFLITVRGDSMTPKYYSGDIVACRKVFLSDLWFQWGKVYIIDTNQGSLLKKVRPGSSEDTITLVSENPEYEPFELRKDQIYNIAIVQGVIRAE